MVLKAEKSSWTKRHRHEQACRVFGDIEMAGVAGIMGEGKE